MGYLLGNHTWDHPNMSALSASAQATEMDRATAEQKALVGAPPCAFGRRVAPTTHRPSAWPSSAG
jgi:peptidoglycan/xylan/chitin deacetylase (PgdA/CDA1 family)